MTKLTRRPARPPAQKSYLDTLAREAGEQLPANLTKRKASEQIDRLRNGLGRRD